MSTVDGHLSELRLLAVEAAKRAGAFVQERAGGALRVECKEAGDSEASQVVTEVDRQAQALILEFLQESTRAFDLGVLAEELGDDGSRFEKEHFWCVDPLDGTLPFTENRSGYAVSIALVSREGASKVGVVYDPRGEILYDAALGEGAKRNGVDWALEPSGDSNLRVFADRSLRKSAVFEALRSGLEELAGERGLGGVEFVCQGGAALNACWTLENGPACYFKLPKRNPGGGSVWDFAATSCLFGELGASFGDVEGEPLELNRVESTFLNHRGFCCATDARLAEGIRRICSDFRSL
ncbi:3'(2'),5'-bisphosphate nucleotidase CysQ family protein [Pelagicoccus mobilis]|uniref:Inositol monophosphatase n=1 Tax=Pelagicoccus mobilis TaxID=415221 RepID=A0A934RZX8_9BACT|nr:inositol monophosphatase family protein [Pelagicoccus mobilis]MBK1876558.1 hypothetical protein [Pelagicoccus mobilis]